MRGKNIIWIIGVSLFLLAPSCQEAPTTPGVSPEEAFEARIPQLMTKWGIPGGSVAVVKDERLVFAKGYGSADREANAPVTTASLFRVASLSKPLTAAAVLRLLQEGRLSLDDPVFRKYLSPAPPPGMPVDPRLFQVTVRHLLEHAGGWDREAGFDPMFYSREIAAALKKPGPSSAGDIIKFMSGQPLDFAPGARYDYSNFGYCVLGRVIEKITGKTYHEALQELVLGPAGITGMTLGRTRLEDAAAGEVRYYDFSGADPAASVFPPGTAKVPGPYGGFYIEAMDAHGGWLASATDLLKFLVRIDGRTRKADILEASTVQTMIARPDLSDWSGAATYYALGWQIRPVGGDANWWHTGSLPGTTSILVRAANGLAWAGLFNSRPLDADGFALELDRTFWDAVGAVTAWPETDLFPASAVAAEASSERAVDPGLVDAPMDSSASGSSPGRGPGRAYVVAGVILSPRPGSSLVVIRNPAGDSAVLKEGQLVGGQVVAAITGRGIRLRSGRRSAFVPVNGSFKEEGPS
jgi:CubicO group peptidase (beta-lactamase class C family)